MSPLSCYPRFDSEGSYCRYEILCHTLRLMLICIDKRHTVMGLESKTGNKPHQLLPYLFVFNYHACVDVLTYVCIQVCVHTVKVYMEAKS